MAFGGDDPKVGSVAKNHHARGVLAGEADGGDQNGGAKRGHGGKSA